MALLALLLAAASALRAQGQQPALQGLPEFGVTLTDSPQNPIVENHSGKTVIGYVAKFSDTHGRGKFSTS
jgi:hypothetical protein